MFKIVFISLLLSITCSLFGQSNIISNVNEARILGRINALAKYGKDSLGRGFRVAYSKGDVEGRNYIIGLMKAAGLTVTIDYGGNIIGLRKGKGTTKKIISFGSHTDMVPNGGDYDGALGVIGALEVIETLNEKHIVTEHPLEMIVFQNEEGGEIGSHIFLGHFNKLALNEISKSGLTIKQGIEAIGGNTDSLDFAKQSGDNLKAYFELHIEQGGNLESEKLNIGVVEGIVGIEEWEVQVEGFANHAGTTPMNKRQDALLAASKLIIAANQIVTSIPGSQVENVGKLSVDPGAANVIPGKVVFNLEIRDLSKEKIFQIFNKIEAEGNKIAKNSDVKITFKNLHMSSTPALMNSAMQNIIKSSAKELGLTYKVMASGAGHDAQEMAVITPTAMIFIPSVGGISHSPKEYSKSSDMANGVKVLLESILKIDKQP